MHGYVVQITHASLGSGPAKFESVHVLADDESAAVTLVRAALRLDGEDVHVVRMLKSGEVKVLGLKPFQVKHLEKLPPIKQTIRKALGRADQPKPSE